MRRAVLLGLLACACLLSPAQAAAKFSTPLGQIFDRVCLGVRPDFDQSLEGLEGAGYIEVTTPEDAGKGIRKYESQAGEVLWTVLVADRTDALAPTSQRIRACTVSGPDETGAAEAELRGWLGLPKAAPGERTSVSFVEKDGKRALVPKSDAAFAAAMKDGGFWTLAVVDAAGGKLAALVFASPAP
ncbi:hypothetical protein [Caulobacter sp. NIBR1757]|uniref:hypothetical protein n=1 Tax=Caulobacter sp. NIBR1757 TaxID=3016000 RepID=UPI0022F0F3FD|nr:hypothetical protein [Caulobacter sp. NIBR1757]WGM39725.1 hypothetical protein AMEJIAPC_02651 [Caulobacter sp. NIBR1757]